MLPPNVIILASLLVLKLEFVDGHGSKSLKEMLIRQKASFYNELKESKGN